MTPEIESKVSLKPLNTLGLTSTAEFFTKLSDQSQLPGILEWISSRNAAVLWLGGGSNLVLAESIPGLVVQVSLKGIELVSERDQQVSVEVAAGENWHDFVLYCVNQNLHGLENLALIPGTVGAAPVQNIGAYGVEAGDLIDAVEVLDTQTGTTLWLNRDNCQFAYRDSLFKRSTGRYLILKVRFRLSRCYTPNLSYAALRSQLEQQQTPEPTPQQLVEAVCAVRRSKLPDPEVLSNAGSFFKNPVVSSEIFDALEREYPNIPNYPDENGIKLAAGWLIDQSGWKGKQLAGVGVHRDQALVLVNYGEATRQQIESLAREIQSSVQKMFGVSLEQEPIPYP